MKAYCITLKGCENRQEMTLNTLKRIGLNCEVFFGVDARKDAHPLLKHLDRRQFEFNMGRPCIIGEAGCYASHYLLWEKCVELNEPIIIFEDDLKIEDDMFLNTLKIVEENIRKCGYIRTENTSRRGLLYNVKQYGDQQLVKYLKVPQCTTSYAISPSAAKAFIAASQTFQFPVDVFLRNTWLHRQAMFGVQQAGLSGGSQPSIIGNRKHQGNKNWLVVTIKSINKAKSMLLNLAMNGYHLIKLGREYGPKKFNN
ncbi:glycosyltransferase family 25 protein [Vibrio metschnikovii]|nr:glycosyltransferase family 25 protein [Vibrio metschnikovii]